MNATNRDQRRHWQRVSQEQKDISNKEAEVPCKCGKFGHDNEGCWLLEKGDNRQLVVVDTLPIADKMNDKGKDNKGKEGLV